MLVLSRNVGESLIIGDDIQVAIVGIKGGYVRIGVEAPKHIEVHRQEVYDRLQQGSPPPEKQEKPVIITKNKIPTEEEQYAKDIDGNRGLAPQYGQRKTLSLNK